MIFAANSALTSRSSGRGRFRSAKTFPELGVDSLFVIFPLLTFRTVCEQVEAAAGLDPVLVAESRFPTSLSSGRHEARKSLPQTVPHTPHDTFHPDRPHAPARLFPQSRARSSRSHASARSALGTTRNRASAEPRGESPSAGRASRQAKPTYAVVPASQPLHPTICQN